MTFVIVNNIARSAPSTHALFKTVIHRCVKALFFSFRLIPKSAEIVLAGHNRKLQVNMYRLRSLRSIKVILPCAGGVQFK
jgi:hypothetical protein